MGPSKEGRDCGCCGRSVDQQSTTSIRPRCQCANQNGDPPWTNNLQHNLSRRASETARVAANTEQCFRESGLYRPANTSNVASIHPTQLANRYLGSADVKHSEYSCGEFRGQPGTGDAGACARREDSGYEPAIDRAALIRGRVVERRTPGREYRQQ